MILHFPINEEKDTKNSSPRISQLSIFAGADYLVTVHQGDHKLLVDMYKSCKSNQQQRNTIMGKSSGYLLHSIIDVLVDDLFHILKKVVGNIHDIEDDVFNEHLAIARDLAFKKRNNNTTAYYITIKKNYVVSKAFSAKVFRRGSHIIL